MLLMLTKNQETFEGNLTFCGCVSSVFEVSANCELSALVSEGVILTVNGTETAGFVLQWAVTRTIAYLQYFTVSNFYRPCVNQDLARCKRPVVEPIPYVPPHVAFR
jgi:hypothetical protein